MGRSKNKRPKYNYAKNRRRQWKNSKQPTKILCNPIKESWDAKKSVQRNLQDMGLAYDSNKSLMMPKPKMLPHRAGKGKSRQFAISETMDTSAPDTNKMTKPEVMEALELEAGQETGGGLRLSTPEVRYCIYMMETHGDDYMAMAKDDRNYYQDTPKQIMRKIRTFKGIPQQYNEYLKSKEEGKDWLAEFSD